MEVRLHAARGPLAFSLSIFSIFYSIPDSLTAEAVPMALDYRCRYICQSGEPDHLLCAQGLSDGRAIVAGNRGLALIDLSALTTGGTGSYLFRLQGVNARDVLIGEDQNYIFVNTHRGEGTGSTGFEVVQLSGNTMKKVATREEEGILYEKMCLRGSYLYVAAHGNGLRIFDIADPENPGIAGKLEEGFVDAFAVAVEGDTAYVADGAGGLKVVDVSNPASPSIIAGECLETARGTSEDVVARDGRVYVAAGGAGLAVYTPDDLSSRALQEVDGCAESLAWIGDHLAVGTIKGVVIYEIGPGTAVTPVASELSHRLGESARLRLLNGVGAAPGNLLLCANWNFMDVFELKEAAASSQPDINCSVQRLRFPPGGGAREVTITHNGRGVLNISSVSPRHRDFSTDYSGGSLSPGESVSFQINYQGSDAQQGEGVVLVHSNDPDEEPLPIQVFGNTRYLDPGEEAVDFSLPAFRRDPETGALVESSTFTLSENRGKVVWFTVFATW